MRGDVVRLGFENSLRFVNGIANMLRLGVNLSETLLDHVEPGSSARAFL